MYRLVILPSVTAYGSLVEELLSWFLIMAKTRINDTNPEKVTVTNLSFASVVAM